MKKMWRGVPGALYGFEMDALKAMHLHENMNKSKILSRDPVFANGGREKFNNPFTVFLWKKIRNT